jgi:hypothetical protein
MGKWDGGTIYLRILCESHEIEGLYLLGEYTKKSGAEHSKVKMLWVYLHVLLLV